MNEFHTHSLYADVAHLVERHLAKVEVASSSLVIRSIFFIKQNMALQPSGKARVCKTLIPRFKSGCHLQNKSTAKAVLFCFHRQIRQTVFRSQDNDYSKNLDPTFLQIIFLRIYVKPINKSVYPTDLLKGYFGADYGARTRHLDLGKVALYQMS